ncbi:MAG: hypothetical protein QOJ48_1546 [Frankiales bacterium]|jgi:predicted lipid-binding transport protein (Tim44 family)|nr:hypothetical protein [Frankiales bacterium]
MTTPNLTAAPPATADITAVASGLGGALWLLGAAFLGLLAIYFIGIDQGMVSVFGTDLHVHEFVHDGRHFLGFPCH